MTVVRVMVQGYLPFCLPLVLEPDGDRTQFAVKRRHLDEKRQNQAQQARLTLQHLWTIFPSARVLGERSDDTDAPVPLIACA